MLDTLGYHGRLSGAEVDGLIAKIDQEEPAHHAKEFVLCVVLVQ